MFITTIIILDENHGNGTISDDPIIGSNWDDSFGDVIKVH